MKPTHRSCEMLTMSAKGTLNSANSKSVATKTRLLRRAMDLDRKNKRGAKPCRGFSSSMRNYENLLKALLFVLIGGEIGRESCGGGEWRSGGAGAFKKKKN